MSRLRELIDKLCPDGVEHKPLGEVVVCHDSKRKPVTKKNRVEGPYPYYGAAGIQDYVSDFIFDGKYVLLGEDGTVVLPNGHPVVTWAEGKIWVNNHAHVLTGNCYLRTRYLFYALQTVDVRAIVSGLPPKINQANMRGIVIPVPPIEVQREIVRILDSFQELDDALTAEIEARERQFEAVLSKLMPKASNNVSMVKLGSQMTVVRGASPRPIKNYLTNGSDGVHWIKIGDVGVGGKYVTNTAEYVTPAGAAKSRLLKRGSLILSNSMSFGRPYILDIDGCIHDGWLAMSNYESSYDRDFLYYLLRSDDVQTAWNMAASTSTVRNLNADIVRDTLVPMPNMDDQLETVRILDELMALTDTLRTERDARRKQFEHYRDRLLSLPERAAS